MSTQLRQLTSSPSFIILGVQMCLRSSVFFFLILFIFLFVLALCYVDFWLRHSCTATATDIDRFQRPFQFSCRSLSVTTGLFDFLRGACFVMEYGKERVVALVDMDCFYVQVEQRLNPALKNTPCVVAQYKTWKGGGWVFETNIFF